MKLFVWVNPYYVDYGNTLLFVVAEDVESAKEMATKRQAYQWGDLEQESLPKVDLGEPSRVLELPCAEWHYWAE
jgi:hypothetical protein